MLAIAGGKGGCGKTATALGIGLALAAAGGRPIVVDADVDMPDLHERAGAAPTPGFDALRGEQSVSTVVQRDHEYSGVGVVPAGGGQGLATALERYRQAAGRAVIDCPAGAGPDAATPMQVADRTVVVSTPTPASLQDAAKTAAMSRAVDTPVAGLVVRETSAVGASGRRRDRYADVVEAPLLGTVPYVDGRPLSSRAVRRSYRTVARALVEADGSSNGDAGRARTRSARTPTDQEGTRDAGDNFTGR